MHTGTDWLTNHTCLQNNRNIEKLSQSCCLLFRQAVFEKKRQELFSSGFYRVTVTETLSSVWKNSKKLCQETLAYWLLNIPQTSSGVSIMFSRNRNCFLHLILRFTRVQLQVPCQCVELTAIKVYFCSKSEGRCSSCQSLQLSLPLLSKN